MRCRKAIVFVKLIKIMLSKTTIYRGISLNATNNNTLTLTSSSHSSLSITTPTSKFYPSTSFTPSGTAALISCSGLCLPVGQKVGYLSPTGSASLSLPLPPSSSPGPKFAKVHYCNNDIALSTSWEVAQIQGI